MEKTWNITIDGSQYHLTLNKELTINGQFFALSDFKKKTHLREYEYFIPLGSKTAVLHLLNNKTMEPVLTIDGQDCITGEVYEVEKVPLWAWFFVIPYIFNILYIMGGAIGGALSGAFACISLTIAADRKKSTVSKVLICIAIYAAVTVLCYLIGRMYVRFYS